MENSERTNESSSERQPLSEEVVRKLDKVHHEALRTGIVTSSDLIEAYRSSLGLENTNRVSFLFGVGLIVTFAIATPIFCEISQFLLGVRCFCVQ